MKSPKLFSMVRDMATNKANAVNTKKTEQLLRRLETALRDALRPGFFGAIRIEVVVQDGTIQQVRHHVERIEK